MQLRSGWSINSSSLSDATVPADYIDFLLRVTPDNQDEFMLQMRRFNMGAVGEADCPVFDGLFDYCAVRARPLGFLDFELRS